MGSRGNGSSKAEMEEKDKGYGVTKKTAMVAGGVAGAAAAAWGLYKWLGSSEPEAQTQEKMMKAPGREYYMPRKKFEENPSDYFRNLRGKN